MSQTKQVKITPAKGRPMLTWVGKRPLRVVPALPAQHVETYDPSGDLGKKKPTDAWAEWPGEYPKGGLLFHGDNKEVLAHLLANGFRGKVNLIYIDPPFDSGADYVRKVQLRGAKGLAKIDGEDYTLGEQVQYTDIWANDNYLQFMFERLLLIKELLSENGSIYLQCDWHKSHHLRCLLDEVFGPQGIKNEIIWKRTSARSDSKTYNHIHDTILFYSKGIEFTWNNLLIPHPKDYVDKYYCYRDEDGRRFMALNLTADGVRHGSSGKPWRGYDPNVLNNHWKYSIEKLDDLDKNNKIYWPDKEGGWPRLKKYLDETEGRVLQSIWDDLFTVNSQAAERTDYPTQKSEALITRIVQASSNSGDIVLDCFIGSGTTAAVAQQLGRRWIGCDLNKGAIQTTSKRLQSIIDSQVEEAQKPKQGRLNGTEPDDQPPDPAQLAFTVWRVNDYDLQVQHNEAINLACEYIGVERKRSDAYFDGTLGKKLVKIIPFNHPLSPLDLDELQKELKVRPEEDRNIVLVCLGMELAAQSWLEDWNRHRGADFPNKVEVIELRTDPKYAGFIQHDPVTAKVSIQRDGDKIKVDIEDFISPTIIKRLDMEQSLFKAKITDWRSQVDCVMIDSGYDGQVFNVALSDVPAGKDDLVQGAYELPAPENKTKVAVKIIDMLGEEVLVVAEV